jgi:transcriptional regulator NrdR family protein
MHHIIKRAGHTESYDSRKLYASIYAACLSMREPVGTAEVVADKVVHDVKTWLDKKSETTSNDIRRIAATHLHAYNPDAAYAYLHHRVMW